jgi:hypothetical protein
MPSVFFHTATFAEFYVGQIFVSSNQGGEDETRIDSIDVVGVPLQ